MGRFDIRERDYMNSKDINHIFKMLNALVEKKKELSSKNLVFKK